MTGQLEHAKKLQLKASRGKMVNCLAITICSPAVCHLLANMRDPVLF